MGKERRDAVIEAAVKAAGGGRWEARGRDVASETHRWKVARATRKAADAWAVRRSRRRVAPVPLSMSLMMHVHACCARLFELGRDHDARTTRGGVEVNDDSGVLLENLLKLRLCTHLLDSAFAHPCTQRKHGA
eukprot:6114472-Pleurochrysis_carterae.AAC.3